MINLSSLPNLVKRKKKRLGRGLGSGKGSKSGRGTTRHQTARENIPLHFEGGQAKMTKKFPLLRGKGRNKPRRAKPFIIDLETLNNFKDGAVVDIETLIKSKLADHKAKEIGVKVLSGGSLNRKLTVKLQVSKKAKEAIEKLGGKVS